LQADPAQAGQASQCPICQTPFIIPAPVRDGPSTERCPGAEGSGPNPAAAQPQVVQPPATFDGIDGDRAAGARYRRSLRFSRLVRRPERRKYRLFSVTPATAEARRVEVREPELLHIPCPQCKQLLETPVEMLDQEVLCPFCQAQFQLRRRDSVEFKRRRQQEREMRDRKAEKAWLNYAIAAVVLVVLFLLFLIFSSART
jgi:hypothetical protein